MSFDYHAAIRRCRSLAGRDVKVGRRSPPVSTTSIVPIKNTDLLTYIADVVTEANASSLFMMQMLARKMWQSSAWYNMKWLPASICSRRRDHEQTIAASNGAHRPGDDQKSGLREHSLRPRHIQRCPSLPFRVDNLRSARPERRPFPYRFE